MLFLQVYSWFLQLKGCAMENQAKNKNLIKAKVVKNDEFFTRLCDVEKEMVHYKEQFKNKVVYCNCDNPYISAFWKYFYNNFNVFKLKKLMATHLVKEDNKAYVTEYSLVSGRDALVLSMIPLHENGDFRSEECQRLMDEADIVVSNPPFSLFREYVATLMAHNKKFLVVGNKNAINYKDFFPLFMQNKVWFGYEKISSFNCPNGETQKFGNICWFTNLDTEQRNIWLNCEKHYVPEEYPKYCNFDAINVDRVTDIPADYDGIMGVPITFLDQYNPEQFELVGLDLNSMSEQLGIREIGDEWLALYREQGGTGNYTACMHSLVCVHKGRAFAPYRRILIRRKKEGE